MLRSYRLMCAAGALAVWSSQALAGFPLTLESVVNNADTVAGVPGANWLLGSFGAYQQPSIDNSGNVAFMGTIAGTGITTANNVGYWYGGPGSLSLTTRLGDAPLPGSGGTAFTARQSTGVPMSPSGHMWIGGTVSAGNGVTLNQNDRVIWTGQAGSMSKLAARTNAAPGTASTFSSAVDSTAGGSASLNNAGQSVVFSSLTAGGATGITTGVNDAGVWVGTPGGGLSMVTQRGTQAPGLPAGAISFGFGGTFLNGSSEAAMLVDLSTSSGGVTTSNNATLWSNAGGTMRTFAREGNASPIAGVSYGVSTSTLFPFFVAARQPFNNQGEFLFAAPLGTGSTAADNSALFLDDGTTTSLVKRKGDAAPGIAGSTINALNANESRLNNDSLFAWVAQVAGGVTTANDRALWLSEVGGSDTMVVREGDAAPGLPGALMGEPVNILLNNTGEVVFTSVLQAGFGGVTTANDRTIWGWREDVGLQLIAREGDTHFGVLVSSFGYNVAPNAEGGAVALSDSGWLTFQINATGATAGSAVVRTMIPEPASLAMIVLGGLVVLRRRR